VGDNTLFRGFGTTQQFYVFAASQRKGGLPVACGSQNGAFEVADFGVARIEVQTEGMTPETGTYRWMAP